MVDGVGFQRIPGFVELRQYGVLRSALVSAGARQSASPQPLAASERERRGAVAELETAGYETTPAGSSNSSRLSRRWAAATFSSRCPTDEVPGMRSIAEERIRSQASATWPEEAL